MPLRAIACGLPATSSATITVAVLVPAAAGLYVTLIVHVAAGATAPVQVDAGASLKSAAWVPAIVILVKVSDAVPVFMTVTAGPPRMYPWPDWRRSGSWD